MSDKIRRFCDDFDGLVRRYRDRPALIEARSEQILSYGSLADILVRYRALFESVEARPGATIAAMLPNSVEMLACFLATIYHGYRFAPLSPDAPAPEITRWLKITRPQFALCGDTITENAKDALRSSAPVVEVSLDGKFEFLPDPNLDLSSDPELAQLYLSTSGTTGDPKAMVIDSNVLWSSGRAFADFHEFLDEECRFLNILPMSYLGGLFNLGLIPLARGGSTVVNEAFSGRSFFSFWNTVERFDVNVLWLVPSIVRGLLALAERAKPDANANANMRCCFIGTAATDLATKLKFEKTFGVPLLENFALSETTFFTTETLGSRHRRVEGSVGEPLPYVELSFAPVSEEHRGDGPAAPEILVKTPYLFKGYLSSTGDAEPPAEANGYFPTGDLGDIDEKNRLIIHGRVRDIIKKGGYFISLVTIERLAQDHEDVSEAAAAPVPHAFYGESFDLHVRVAEGVPENWITHVFAPWLHANLAKHMWPERIIVADEFPRTSSGKVQKHLLGDEKEPVS